jgi:hypothetical protein
VCTNTGDKEDQCDCPHGLWKGENCADDVDNCVSQKGDLNGAQYGGEYASGFNRILWPWNAQGLSFSASPQVDAVPPSVITQRARARRNVVAITARLFHVSTTAAAPTLQIQNIPALALLAGKA